jgi:oligosaccharyltransferase complex subunit beta
VNRYIEEELADKICTIARGFKLTFQSPKSDELSLFKHGALAFDHLILTPPKSKGYGPSLTPKALLDFTNAGGNILLTLSSDSGTPSAISSLLLELDIHLSPDRTSVVVDHFNYDVSSSAEQHDTLLLPRPGPLRTDVKNFFGGEGVLAVPKAVGQSLGNTSPLLAPILSAPSTAYSYNPKEEAENVEDPFATGAQITLISAMQARNSARFTVLGSLEMLADKWFDANVKTIGGKSSKTVNRDFARQVTEWTFKEVGVLRVNSMQHYEVQSDKAPGNTTQVGFLNPTIYRIKNDVVCRARSLLLNLVTKTKLDLHHLSLRIRAPHMATLQARTHRCPPTRIHHALALPAPAPLRNCAHSQQHHFLDNLPPS